MPLNPVITAIYWKRKQLSNWVVFPDGSLWIICGIKIPSFFSWFPDKDGWFCNCVPLVHFCILIAGLRHVFVGKEWGWYSWSAAEGTRPPPVSSPPALAQGAFCIHGVVLLASHLAHSRAFL